MFFYHKFFFIKNRWVYKIKRDNNNKVEWGEKYAKKEDTNFNKKKFII